MADQEFKMKSLRLPRDVTEFLRSEAERNLSSQNSEIIRCVRSRMEELRGQRGDAA